jgi:chromosome segregation ATPase
LRKDIELHASQFYIDTHIQQATSRAEISRVSALDTLLNVKNEEIYSLSSQLHAALSKAQRLDAALENTAERLRKSEDKAAEFQRRIRALEDSEAWLREQCERTQAAAAAAAAAAAVAAAEATDAAHAEVRAAEERGDVLAGLLRSAVDAEARAREDCARAELAAQQRDAEAADDRRWLAAQADDARAELARSEPLAEELAGRLRAAEAAEAHAAGERAAALRRAGDLERELAALRTDRTHLEESLAQTQASWRAALEVADRLRENCAAGEQQLGEAEARLARSEGLGRDLGALLDGATK